VLACHDERGPDPAQNPNPVRPRASVTWATLEVRWQTWNGFGCSMGWPGGVEQSDPSSPPLDLSPVAEVAFGENRTGGRNLQTRPFGETEPAGIEGTYEDAVVPRMDGFPEPADLLWLEIRVPVRSLGVGGLSTKWTTSGQPHGSLRPEVLAAHERLASFNQCVQ
jgi:hypothetical protein